MEGMVVGPRMPGALAPPVRRWLLLLPALVVFCAVGLIGVYRYVDNYWLYRGFAPPQDAAYVKERGTTQTIAVSSPAIARRQQVIVYLPPGYASQPTRRYPVLYLLHGFPGRPLAFLETVRLGVLEDELVARGRMSPLILVMPFGSTGTFEDKEWANGVLPHQGWETFVAHDLVRAIDARYRTIASGSARAIGGLSKGGYGSLNIALHHPREFRVVESWSGYMIADRIPSIFGLNALLSAYNSPLVRLPAVATELRRARTYVWFYTGSRDPMLAQNRAFDAALARERVAHRFFVVPGGHTWVAWRGQAENALLVADSRLRHG